MSPRPVLALLATLAGALAARGPCKAPHPDRGTWHAAAVDLKLAIVGVYYNDLAEADRPTEAHVRSWSHNPDAEAFLAAASDGCMDNATVDVFVAENAVGHDLGAGPTCGDSDAWIESAAIDVVTNGAGKTFASPFDYDGVVVIPLGYCSGGAAYQGVTMVIGGHEKAFMGVLWHKNLGGPGWKADEYGDDYDWDDGASNRMDAVYIHELFHLLTGDGHHAQAYVCDEPERDFQDPLHRCWVQNYGDYYDVMGSANGFVPNLMGLMRYNFGWLGADDVEIIRGSGEYAIAAINSGSGKRAAFFEEGPGTSGGGLWLEWRDGHDVKNASVDPAVLDRNRGFFVRRDNWLVDADVASCEPFTEAEKLRTTLLPGKALVLHMDGVTIRANDEGVRADGTMAFEVRFTGEEPACHRNPVAAHTGYFGEFWNCRPWECAGTDGDGQYCDDGACGDHGNFWAPFQICEEACWDRAKRCDDAQHKADPWVGSPPAEDGKYPCWDLERSEVYERFCPDGDEAPCEMADTCDRQRREGRCDGGTRFARVSHHHIWHVANMDTTPGCGPYEQADIYVEAAKSQLGEGYGFEVQKDPNWYSWWPMRDLHMAPGEGRQVHFAYGIPDDQADGTYDTCISFTNKRTGLRRGILHRLTIGGAYDMFRHNRVGAYGAVDYDGDGSTSADEYAAFEEIEAFCEGLFGCHPDYPDCEWDWNPDFCHVEDEVPCEDVDAPLGTRDRCWAANWEPESASYFSYAGRDQCANRGMFCEGGAKLLDKQPCDDPVPAPCEDQGACQMDVVEWKQLYRDDPEQPTISGACHGDGVRNWLPTTSVGAHFLCGEAGKNGTHSLQGTPFCASGFITEADTADWWWNEREGFENDRWAGGLKPGHECWAAPTPAPTPVPGPDQCDEASWPDVARGCGDCKVLVARSGSAYETCDAYCAEVGRSCVGGWATENDGDTCAVAYDVACSETPSGAICECGDEVGEAGCASNANCPGSARCYEPTYDYVMDGGATCDDPQGCCCVPADCQDSAEGCACDGRRLDVRGAPDAAPRRALLDGGEFGSPDVDCARRLCEATDECGGYTVGYNKYTGDAIYLYFVQRGLLLRPDLDSRYVWGHRGGPDYYASGDNECWYKPQDSPTAQECSCFGERADGTSPVIPPGSCAAEPTPAPTPAPEAVGDPSIAPTPAPETVGDPSMSPSPAPSPAPTGGAVADSCKDDADWLAKSSKKKKRKCEKQTKKKKCKKKCEWVEESCVEKLQSCEDLFYKKGKPKKQGAKLVKTCKKQGAIGGAKKVKASAACQKACGTCDDAGAVVGATTTTQGLAAEPCPDKDSYSWRKKGKDAKTCRWVAKNPKRRCKLEDEAGAKARKECPVACGARPECAAPCEDDGAWAARDDDGTIGSKKTCAWLAKKNRKKQGRGRAKRCALVDVFGVAASLACPEACGECAKLAEEPRVCDPTRPSCDSCCPRCEVADVDWGGHGHDHGADGSHLDFRASPVCVCLAGDVDASAFEGGDRTITLTSHDDCAFLTASADGVVVDAGAGDDVVVLGGPGVGGAVDGGAGDDDLTLLQSGGLSAAATVSGGDGDDAIRVRKDAAGNAPARVRAYGGAGDDVVFVTDASYADADGGAGDDVVDVRGVHVADVRGGDGADALSARDSDFATLWGDAGYDVLVSSGGDGNSLVGGADGAACDPAPCSDGDA